MMKNSEQWRPSKFTFRKGKLRGSRNASALGVASRLVADIVARHYQEYVPTFAKGKLIDLGCGKAPLYELYRDHVDSVTCVDWQHSMHDNPFIDKSCDLNDTLPFADNSFDTILLSDVLEHIAHPEQLWGEMSRILTPGGILVLNVPFLYKIHEAPHDYFRYTEYALKRFADHAGFEVLILKAMGGIPEVVSDLLGKLAYKLPGLGSMLATVVQAMCRGFLSVRFGKKISAKTSTQYPLGYFMVCRKSSEKRF